MGGCTPAEADKALAALVDHHLLIPDAHGRFQFRDLTRGYAMARAAREHPAAEQKVVGWLFDYYLHTADQADPGAAPVPAAQAGYGHPTAARLASRQHNRRRPS